MMTDDASLTAAFRREPRWLSCAETGALVRRALRTAFPDVKFRVRSRDHDLAARVFVSYVDGPPRGAVEAVAEQFNGRGFDGSIDMGYRLTHWLLPDGTATFAHTTGTAGSMGNVAEAFGDPPAPDAELVRFGTAVEVSREFSEATLERVRAEVDADVAAGRLTLPYYHGGWIYDVRTEAYVRLDDRDLRGASAS